MDSSLTIKRTHLSYSQKQRDFLESNSDCPFSEGCIFSKVFDNPDSLSSLLESKSLCLPEEFINGVINEYDEEFFKTHNLLVMFSDERSGSNKLTLKEASVNENKISLLINRKRGLTMDMAYLFMFYVLDDKNVTESEVRIEDFRELY